MSSYVKGKGVEKGSHIQNPRDPFSSSWTKEDEKFVMRYRSGPGLTISARHTT